MRILMYGAGALGSYFGGRMSEGELNVSYYVREKRAEQIRKHGLTINSPQGNFETSDVKLFTSPEQIENVDLIIIALKGYHLEKALSSIRKIVQQTEAYVLPLLNGVEHIKKLQQAVGEKNVLGGFASIIATLNSKGHVEHTSSGSAMKFGPLHKEQAAFCEKFAAATSSLRTNVIWEEDILKHMWKKYIFITAFSGVTSASQLPAGYIAQSEALHLVAEKIIREMYQLAELDNINIEKGEVFSMIQRIKAFPQETTSSMHQDMRKGLPLEVEHLHGGALRLAEKHKIALPVIETIYGILKPYENGRPMR
ncbi:ketopantoate reductase family protein [Alkalicoccus saliphilus]|jgi:2-dehydropantoate 2-reductase|uniref:2-dehydropantoate 2-reductase n=1 Tax=Alkalicoccus saliphilus TaxID=200989 RepID=A0A2T4U3M8_9BACI|nr:2-dehydropantoate 2-reductase [Alkalicoccus saliphilus]PTL38000.1 2-dehydropantoate 2-reductase [Alkalicoccus saliphilus]